MKVTRAPSSRAIESPFSTAARLLGVPSVAISTIGAGDAVVLVDPRVFSRERFSGRRGMQTSLGPSKTFISGGGAHTHMAMPV